jgi:hypothetical protein
MVSGVSDYDGWRGVGKSIACFQLNAKAFLAPFSIGLAPSAALNANQAHLSPQDKRPNNLFPNSLISSSSSSSIIPSKFALEFAFTTVVSET